MKRKRRVDRGRAGNTAASEDWVLGRRPAPFIVETPAPHRPEMRVLLDAGAERIIAVEVVEAGDSASTVAEWARGKLRRGIHLRVDERAVAEALRPLVGEGIEVEDAPTPEVDEAVESFEAFTARRADGAREPSWADGAAADAKAGFYIAAGQFERSRPWEKVSDGHVLAIDVPALGWSGGCASILGMAEETFGLLLLRSIADFVRFVRLGEAVLADRRRPPGAGVPILSVNFDRPRDLPGGKKLAAEARAHGFVPGPGGRVPYLLNVTADAVPTPLTTDDYRLATTCLEAVRRFVEKHEGLFTEGPRERLVESSTVAMPGAAIDVVVTCPPADLPWRWGEEEPIEGLRERERDLISTSFHAAREAGGESPEEADAHRWAAHEMLGFKARRGEALTDWTPDDITTYLLDYYPSHGSETGKKLEALPSRLEAFLVWLSASGLGYGARLEAARQRIAGCRDAFLKDASDPRRFGVAKTMMQAMRAANVDPADPAAVDSFVRDFNRRLEDDPSLLPSLPLPRQGKAWVWNHEGPPPDPQGPCPCGSGRRYRKCCMPR